MGGKEITMFKMPRDFNAAECMVWMYKFNPGKVDIYMPEERPRHLISLVPVEQLRFPEGWYYCVDTQTIHKEYSDITVYVKIN